jgi:hypothetical protein
MLIQMRKILYSSVMWLELSFTYENIYIVVTSSFTGAE